MKGVFISHYLSDFEWAKRIANKLENGKFKVIFSADLENVENISLKD